MLFNPSPLNSILRLLPVHLFEQINRRTRNKTPKVHFGGNDFLEKELSVWSSYGSWSATIANSSISGFQMSAGFLYRIHSIFSSPSYAAKPQFVLKSGVSGLNPLYKPKSITTMLLFFFKDICEM
jgi:hypothetical protein